MNGTATLKRSGSFTRRSMLKEIPEGSRIAPEVDYGCDEDVASIRPIENPKRPLLQHRPSKRAPKRCLQMRKLGDQVQQTRQFAGKSLFGTWLGIAQIRQALFQLARRRFVEDDCALHPRLRRSSSRKSSQGMPFEGSRSSSSARRSSSAITSGSSP